MPSSDGPDADVKIDPETTTPDGAPIVRAPIEQRTHALTVFDGADEEGPGASPHAIDPLTATRLDDFAAAMAGPLAAAILTRSAALFIGAALFVLLVRTQGRRSALTDAEVAVISPVAAGLAGGVLAFAVLPADGAIRALAVGLLAFAVGAAATLLQRAIARRSVHTRIALLGDARSAHELAWRLASDRQRQFTVVGFVNPGAGRDDLREIRQISFKVRRLGQLTDLSRIVARNDIDLLVMAGRDGRLDAFERAAICNDRFGTRLISLAAFEETVFRRVDLDQLDAAWFQHVMHPRFRPVSRIVTRAIDIAFALTAGLLTLPLWAPALLLVRTSFGRPVLVARRRVGEQGQAIALRRFRVAPPEVTGAPPAEESPASGAGRLLRRSGVERIPVLLDLLHGDVTLVGPRPVHPRELAARERDLRYYGRRQMLRPGLTGWARIRGCTEPDEEFSADLFYLKHQSLMLLAYVLLVSLRPRTQAHSPAK